MKKQIKNALIIGALGLFSLGAAARGGIPHEIYQPRGAEIVKADRQGNGEFEAEFLLYEEDISVKRLAKRVIEHARDEGFRVEEREIKHDDADLKFKRGDQELDVSIELKDNGRIEYKADLDLDKS